LRRFAFAEGAFDLVMARAMSAFMPASRYPELMAEMTRVARPGGWIELRDFGLVRSGSRVLTELTELFKHLMAARRHSGWYRFPCFELIQHIMPRCDSHS